MRPLGEGSWPASPRAAVHGGELHGRPRHLAATVYVLHQETESVGEPMFILEIEGLKSVSTKNIPISFWI